MNVNECRNWKASTLKTHAHSADNKQSVITETNIGSFSVSNETRTITKCD